MVDNAGITPWCLLVMTPESCQIQSFSQVRLRSSSHHASSLRCPAGANSDSYDEMHFFSLGTIHHVQCTQVALLLQSLGETLVTKQSRPMEVHWPSIEYQLFEITCNYHGSFYADEFGDETSTAADVHRWKVRLKKGNG